MKQSRIGVFLTIKYIPKRKRKEVRKSFSADTLELVIERARNAIETTDKICSAWYQQCEIWDEIEGYSMFRVNFHSEAMKLDFNLLKGELCAHE